MLEDKTSNATASPFVKWAGGKRRVMEHLLKRLPDNFNTYYEPFVGGGALFFELSNTWRSALSKSVLSDSNSDLIHAYQAIKNNPEPLIKRLELHAELHNEEYYYQVRSQHNLQDPLDVAARLMYLNKTCFNGLWRVNSRGEFNVPIGRYKNPNIIQRENIARVSAVLDGVGIHNRNYKEIKPCSGDFVYFDPPYHPLDVNSFTKYSKDGFSEEDQVKLRDLALRLNSEGVSVMLSNSNAQFILDIYGRPEFKIDIINAPRTISSSAKARKPVGEVLVTTY